MGLRWVKCSILGLLMGLASVQSGAEETPEAKVLALANGLASISSSTDAPEVLHGRLCQMIRTNMDIEGIGNTLLGAFRKNAPTDSLEAFYAIIPQSVVQSFRSIYELKNFTTEIKRIFEDEKSVDVHTVLQASIPYNVIFTLVPAESGGFLVRNATIEGLSMLLSRRSNVQHDLRRLRRAGSKDPVADLAVEMAEKSTPCP
ncbi:MAG: ABC transporter substrate-binding protein [Bdellovibrionaceae bacterium]|nr:ABC transporter substrate-binding protein [Bdellovibrionales bacterium]MCB9082766.1 ABC transporter substrate-binding protein [Pseudobdellovibrionaceae bacterium]